MSRRTRKRVEYIADWLVSDAEVNGWFWPELLAARSKQHAARINRKRRPYWLALRIKKPFTDGLPF